MFDTVWMYYKRLSKAEKDHLYNISERSKDLSKPDYIRYVDNFRLEFTQNRKTVRLRGSIAKFYQKNNIEALTIQQTREALELLSDTLKIPLEQAILTRLDIGFVFPMKYSPEQYIDRILSAPYLDRVKRFDSLYLENGSRQIIIYDKLKENGKNPLPESFKGHKNLLKYELRVLKDLKSKLGGNKVTSLYDPLFYEKTLDKYIQEFQKIKFIPSVNIDMSRSTTPNQIEKNLNAYLLSNQSGNFYANLMNELKKARVFKYLSYYSRFENELIDTLNSYSIDTSDTFVDELTQKVESVKDKFASLASLESPPYLRSKFFMDVKRV